LGLYPWRHAREEYIQVRVAMEFVAVCKSGVYIYALPQDGADTSNQVTHEPVASLPTAGSAAGYAWSNDGSKLATVDQGKAIIWDPENKYKKVLEIDPVGESGGARAGFFSPRGSFLITFEKFEKDKCPENMIVWDLRASPKVSRARSLQIRSYQSGKITEDPIHWTPDEALCLELIAGEGLVLLDVDLKAGETHITVPEPNATQFSIAPKSQNDGYYVALYIPEAANAWGAWDLTGRPGEVAIYHIHSTTNEIKKVTFQNLPRKLNSVTMLWNAEGTALLAQADSDVDETGESYFGTSSLFWVRADGKMQCRIAGPEDGLVQDVAWSPVHNEFLVIVGMMPATTKLYDGKQGKLVKDGTLGTSRRNTIRWCPFGRFLVVGGFGALPGDLDFYDRPSGETLCSFRANLTVNCCWGPSGRHFLTCTTAPRMNEDNQISVWGYNDGAKILKVDFKPVDDPTRGAGGGGMKAADAGAMLWAASWRPDGKGTYKDRAASPPPKGVKRVKALPEDNKKAASGAGAYRPAGGGGFSGVAAMMRGELEAPAAGGFGVAPTGGDRPSWETGVTAVKLTWQEEAALQKDWDKQKKQLAKKEKADVEEGKQAAKDEISNLTKKFENDAKLLIQLKEQLAGLDGLKDKDWDELTSDDEAQLETELDLKAQIAEMEKGKGKK